MRQLLIQAPRGEGVRILETAKEHGSVSTVRFEGEAEDEPLDVVIVHVPNRSVEALLRDLQDIDRLRVSLFPQGVLALQPPRDETPNEVTNVELRSPLEIYLSGLQSIGSWKGYLGYAAVAGAVVWIGLFTNTVYLLVGAMLIAPFAGPAVNVAIGTARGDLRLAGRGVARYFAGIATSFAVAALLSLALNQESVTSLMVDVSRVPATAVLLPVAAGAAGSLWLVQSERTSLVSSAGVGILIAASLAPPVGVAAMALVLGEWALFTSAAFLILLQLAGINLAAALVFRVTGVTAHGARYPHGDTRVHVGTVAATLAVLVGLLAWQFAEPVALERATLAERAAADVRQLVAESDLAHPVDVTARFTGGEAPAENTLLVTAYVQRRADTDASADEVRATLTDAIRERLAAEYDVLPLVDVTVLDAPRAA